MGPGHGLAYDGYVRPLTEADSSDQFSRTALDSNIWISQVMYLITSSIMLLIKSNTSQQV